MLTRRLIVMVVIMFVGLAAIVISYKWRKSAVKTPVVDEVAIDGMTRSATDPRDADKRAVRWLVEHGIRLRKGIREIIDPDEFDKRPQYSALYVEFLSADQVTPESISHLKKMSKITSVSFYDTSITDEHATLVSELTNAQELNLNYTEVTDVGLARLASLPGLEGLGLNGTHVTDEGLSHIHESMLRRLALYDTAVTDNCLVELAKLPQLSMLDVQKTGVTPAGVSRFRENNATCVIYSDPY